MVTRCRPVRLTTVVTSGCGAGRWNVTVATAGWPVALSSAICVSKKSPVAPSAK